jgi:DnaJ like chaperone protein
MSESHPDKLAAKGMPPEMRAMAEERAREINVAYDLIRQARQFR